MLSYIEPVFRPPSEAYSLILQVTNGCSWNNCTFCEMYTQEQKKFKARKEEEVEQDIINASKMIQPFEKVFLADGDAMVLPMRRLKAILQSIKQHMPWVKRVSSYCLPRNLKKKSVDDLKELQALGLDMLYVGCESGDDTVLEKVNKGETYETQKDALQKIHAAGLRSSVMILNGLGGPKLSEQHALNSARLMNETQPHFLSTLVVSFPLGEDRLKQGFDGDWELMDQHSLFLELKYFIENLELENTVFRSDHASNYLPLKGTLGKDKQQMLDQIQMALTQPEKVRLRQEWQRGL
ncbi:radical SAM protein [Bermanella marisrubri]|uniref:Radical SAM domain protein n=1 Tax=Bermanella marisrubri TaxID=207949 RepID=Q1MY02_9GAMM|nr:radical SAM protein [Bermanella marisrubri]EAT10827.1 radical SAM domain protein [Oceanobacter sp. RED65] [Bermanella marisrubri]QIZ84209.1 radical SAM protein [Bermanella marisrubri]